MRSMVIVSVPALIDDSYGRIETLSGFANGIFLILISVFIVFEAIQRLYVRIYSSSCPRR